MTTRALSWVCGLAAIAATTACHRHKPVVQPSARIETNEEHAGRVQKAHEDAQAERLAQEQHAARVEADQLKRQEERRSEREAQIKKRDEDAVAYRAALEKDSTDRRVAGIAKLGPEGREKLLRACYAGTQNCSQMAVDIYAVTQGAERSRVAALSASLLAARARSWSTPSTDPLFCCDGSESTECVVGSKLASCCVENGGPCGYGIRR